MKLLIRFVKDSRLFDSDTLIHPARTYRIRHTVTQFVDRAPVPAPILESPRPAPLKEARRFEGLENGTRCNEEGATFMHHASQAAHCHHQTYSQ